MAEIPLCLRERDDVGRAGTVKVLPVDLADGLVIDEKETDFAFRAAKMLRGLADRAADPAKVKLYESLPVFDERFHKCGLISH